jgi:antitoxin HicB
MRPEDYPFEVSPLSEDDGGGCLITFPDLPGCLSDGETPEEAIHNGFDAAQAWLDAAKEFGDTIPQPGYAVGAWLAPQLPRSLHHRLTEVARAEGVDVGTLAAVYIAEGLAKYEVDTPTHNAEL